VERKGWTPFAVVKPGKIPYSFGVDYFSASPEFEESPADIFSQEEPAFDIVFLDDAGSVRSGRQFQCTLTADPNGGVGFRTMVRAWTAQGMQYPGGGNHQR